MDTNPRVFRSPLTVLGAFIGIALVIAALVGAYTFYRIQLYGGSLSVTGSAKTRVTSDQVKWTMNISRQISASALKSGYDQLSGDLARVTNFFASHGIATTSLAIAPVSVDEVYDYSYKSDPSVSREKQYSLRQLITYTSNDVQGVTILAKEATDLVRDGVIFQSAGLEYSYSKLSQLRVALLADAIRDAKARAEKLAEPSGQTVGALRSASLGVVQVLAPNSIDVSDYGMYDTSSIDKDVMVTVRAAFAIR